MNPCSFKSINCGVNAECRAENHQGTCVCPVGTQGNPFISCITGQCQYNEDCADHETCNRLNRICVPVCTESTCAQDAQCIGRNHEPVCTCRHGYTGNPFIQCTPAKPLLREECYEDADCPSKLACFDHHCENPCSKPNVCGIDQSCSVLDTLPLRTVICKCPADMITDHTGKCTTLKIEKAQCQRDSDCDDPDKCLRGYCVLACRIEQCGINALCKSQSHNALCTCAPGYEGNPYSECSSIPKTPNITYVPECYVDTDCPYDKTCENDVCVNPCRTGISCGYGAFCHPRDHLAVCTCPISFTGNAKTGCYPIKDEVTIGCKSNSECKQTESCVNDQCISPCNCGENTECIVENHHPICHCKPGYSGNSLYGCYKLECEHDNECNDNKQCANNQCVDPCIVSDPCAINAECYGKNHRASCRCHSGLEGNPFELCKRVECHTDYECPGDRSCVNEHCVDPCKIGSPCAYNALCYVRNHVVGCKCPEDMPNGNPESYCEVSRDEIVTECIYDSDCPSKMACIQNTCVDPCLELQPCRKSAKCHVLDSVPIRTMICECAKNHVPDHTGECRPIKPLIKPECTSDFECSDKEACINNKCRNPCDCGENALCTIQNHRAICSCADGHDGNPNFGCKLVGCRSDYECDPGKSCINNDCVNPCLINNPCGTHAECVTHENRAECKCLSGYRGNPYEICHIIGCTSNSDCPSDKKCLNTQCVDPCVYDSQCSPRAECKAKNHMAVCKCPPGLEGNPYIDCRPQYVPECEFDTDCPSQLACIDSHCKNPCNVLEPCHYPSTCEVVPSAPVRTMICVCPDGYISSGSGTCKPTKPVFDIGGCTVDGDCASDKACINGICRDPCNCGLNAECRIKDHKPVCSCAQGYDGNPQLECVRIGCASDSECSGQHTCVNRQCVPVCASDGSTCALNAECYGINHRPRCECLPGFSGNPKVSCTILGCRSDSECPSDKACINQNCVDPCERTAVCAVNENCNVYNHRPECSCPPGTEKDYHKGCQPIEEICRYDEHCPSQTACIGGECINPCNASQPCGVNSVCKVLDTIPVRTMICECLPGYQGNAAVQCDKSKFINIIIYK